MFRKTFHPISNRSVHCVVAVWSHADGLLEDCTQFQIQALYCIDTPLVLHREPTLTCCSCRQNLCCRLEAHALRLGSKNYSASFCFLVFLKMVKFCLFILFVGAHM